MSASGGQEEERGVADMRQVVKGDHCRPESKTCEENAAYHGRRQISGGAPERRRRAVADVPRDADTPGTT